MARIGLDRFVGGVGGLLVAATLEIPEWNAAKAQGSNGLRRIPRSPHSIARSASPVHPRITLPRI